MGWVWVRLGFGFVPLAFNCVRVRLIFGLNLVWVRLGLGSALGLRRVGLGLARGPTSVVCGRGIGFEFAFNWVEFNWISHWVFERVQLGLVELGWVRVRVQLGLASMGFLIGFSIGFSWVVFGFVSVLGSIWLGWVWVQSG